jgi:hypothetical protein
MGIIMKHKITLLLMLLYGGVLVAAPCTLQQLPVLGHPHVLNGAEEEIISWGDTIALEERTGRQLCPGSVMLEGAAVELQLVNQRIAAILVRRLSTTPTLERWVLTELISPQQREKIVRTENWDPNVRFVVARKGGHIHYQRRALAGGVAFQEVVSITEDRLMERRNQWLIEQER